MSTKKVAYVALAVVMVVNLLAASVVSAAPPQQEEATYTVKLGDNLWTLAEKYLGSGPAYSAIVAATNAKHEEDETFAYIANPSLIHPGWKLVIPAGEEAGELLAEPEAKAITITFFEEPDTMNPLYTSMWFAGLPTDFWLVPLWYFDEQGTMIPELAAELPTVENGGISEDGTVLTIKLRPEVWSDGTPLTADDFVFHYEMIMDDGNAVQSRYPFDTFVESVTALDDQTLEVVMSEPYAAWATGLFPTAPLPKHILEPVFEAEGTIDGADWNRNPTVGVGPFLFKEWEAASHLIFEANPDYWRGKPKLDQISIRIVPDEEAQKAALRTGDSDLGVYMYGSDIPDVAAMEDVEMVGTAGGWVESWFFNLISEELAEANGLAPGHPALQDKRVRQAVVMGVDRQQIIDELVYGVSRIPPVFWYDSPYEDTSIEPWPYDPAAAEALLDEAGWVDSNGDGTRDKDGVELVLRYSTTAGNELREATQVVVQQMLAEIGVGIEILNYSYDIIWNTLDAGGPIAAGLYDFAEWSTQPADFPDPNDSGWLCDEIPSEDSPAGNNWQGVCMEELDELLIEQAVTADMATRQQMFSEIQSIMHEEMFWMGVRTDPDLWAVNNRLQNVRLSGTDAFWNCWEWDVY